MVYGECFGHDFMVLHHVWRLTLLHMCRLLSLTQWAVVSLSYSPVSQLLPWKHLDDEEFLCALNWLQFDAVVAWLLAPGFIKQTVLLIIHDCSSQVTYVCWFLVLSCYRVSLQNLLSLLLSQVLKNLCKNFKLLKFALYSN